MKVNIEEWLNLYITKMKQHFGNRICFMGLQGSYSRDEATDTSDIDVVLILDTVTFNDLQIYNGLLDTLPERDKICGFVSGKNEIISWDKADLFQFCHDTTAIIGSLDELLQTVIEVDVKRAIHMGACNIYHACVHNVIHEKSIDILKELYKSATFVLQAIAYLQNGVFVKKQQNLLTHLNEIDKRILEIRLALKNDVLIDFDTYSEILMNWASYWIKKTV